MPLEPSGPKVLFIQNGSALGGSGESLLVLVGHLLEQGYRPLVLVNNAGPLTERLERLGVPVEIAPLNLFSYNETRYVQERRLREPSSLRWLLRQVLEAARALYSYPKHAQLLQRLVRKHQPDLIHLNEMNLLVAGLAAYRTGLPLVWHVRSIITTNLWGRFTGWLIPRLAHQVVAVSRAAASRVDQRRANLRVVYNGVDLARFDPSVSGAAARAEWGIPASAPLVGFLGKTIRSKGAFDLLAAVPAILAQCPDAHFLVVGGDPAGGGGRPPQPGLLRRAFKQALLFPTLPGLPALVAEQGLAGRVHLTGGRQDVPALLAAMDVVALPTWTEGFGRTIIEALAMRKPVVSTQVDAIPELIEDGRSGLLVPPRDPRALAQAVVRFLRDPALSASCAAFGYQSVQGRFSSGRYASEVERLYGPLLSGQTAPARQNA